MPAIIRIKKEDPSGITTPPSGNATMMVGFDVVSGVDYNNHITLKLDDGTLKRAGQWIIEDTLTNATGLPFAGRSDLPETLKDLAQLLPACAGVRRWGAAALDLAYVAAGRYDGYWERRLNVWDIAAGVIIAREAGAIVEGIAANSDPIETADILCANDLQFNQFAALIRGA